MRDNRPLTDAEIEKLASKLVEEGTAPNLGVAREWAAIASGRIDGTRLLDAEGKLIRQRPRDPEWLRGAPN